jgi:hypothetical protein
VRRLIDRYRREGITIPFPTHLEIEVPGKAA